MTRQRKPEDAIFVLEWKKTAAGLIVSIGIVLIFAGLMLWAIAAIPEFTYQTVSVPPDVQHLVYTTRQTSAALLVVGGGLIALGLIGRH